MYSGVSTFEEKLNQLDGFLADWGSKGFDVRNNRVAQYRRTLERVIALGAEGRGKLTDREAADMILMFEEIEQFIFSSARTLPHPHLVASAQAKEMFSGTLLAGTESKTSPRDFMFELSTAGLIEESGISTDLSRAVDIRAMFEGRPVLVECKRPQSLEKLPTNVRKAAQQLETRVNARQPWTHFRPSRIDPPPGELLAG